MRYFCAAVAMYAVCLSTLFVPVSYAQKRIRSTGPKAAVPAAPVSGHVTPDNPESLAPSSSQIDIVGPAGSGQFGYGTYVLSNGNIVVTDPFYDITSPSTVADVGAVYLYDGETQEMISQLTGSSANDNVGYSGIVTLSNGNFVIPNAYWKNGTAAFAGAVTWASATDGVSGVVSAANSLIGSRTADGIANVTALTNGNYVVHSINWDNGAAAENAGSATFCNGTTGTFGAVSQFNSLVGTTPFANVGGQIFPLPNGNYVVYSNVWPVNGANGRGAVTWGSGVTGVTGPVSDTNSLVGTTAGDHVGSGGITILPSGNYVVSSGNWDNGPATNAGAVTWGNGLTGVTGAVSPSNSLVGATANDSVGSGGIRVLTNGNFVISSSSWDNGAVVDAGAITWANGTSGTTGILSSSNSLVGTTAFDRLGNGGVAALANGNYVMWAIGWDNGATANVGAVTWGNGATGTFGSLSASNSLVGGVANSLIGSGGVTALSNGNYVVRSGSWANGAATSAGAVTWGNGTSGTSGVVSVSNSLVGTTTGDSVGGNSVVALNNGNYVVVSSAWDNGAATNAGAVTWVNGETGGPVGPVSASNSLVGSASFDGVGDPSVVALTNGNYVVASSAWAGAGAGRGAATWGNGATGTTGVVSASNSLIGAPGDRVGFGLVTALPNGNYLVLSPNWKNGSALTVGAVTWGNGTAGTIGLVTAGNSLVGSTADDRIGNGGITALTNGNYVVRSSLWDNGANSNVGAVTWGSGTSGVSGVVSPSNSLVGSTASDQVGNGPVIALPNGNYAFGNMFWNNGALENAAALVYGAGNTGTSGVISSSNSVMGTVALGSVQMAGPSGVSNERLVAGRPISNTVSVFNPTYRAVADGSSSNGETWNYGAFTKPHDLVVPSGRTMTLDADVPGPGGSLTVESGAQLIVNGDLASASPITNEGSVHLSGGKLSMGSNIFSSGCGAIQTGISDTSYIIGALEKSICSTGLYTIGIGSADGYAPLLLNVTSLNVNPSSLMISSTGNVHPTLYAPNSLDRFWSITETGDLTADIVFNYLDGDVVGSESVYKLFRIEGAPTPELMPTAVHNAASNRMSISGVSQFSDWAIGSLAPSAAGVSVSGRVMAGDRPVSGAGVTFFGPDGSVRKVYTNSFGYYKIEDLTAGSSYAVAVSSRRYTFDSRIVDLQDNVAGFDFTAR